MDGPNNASSRQTVQRVIENWADWGLLGNRDEYNWYLGKWKNNVNSVGLSYNSPTKGWAQLDNDRGRTSSKFHKGPSAASESETQAIIKLMNE